MIYMFLADGFEEVEAIATLDVIRRANIDIKTVGVKETTVTGSHGIPVVCDVTAENVVLNDELTGVILPGGMPGTNNLWNSETVKNTVEFCYKNNRLVCAICAAPLILGRIGILKGKKAVCFPGFENELIGAEISDGYVCVDGNVITAKGMGSAIDFGIAVVSAIKGPETASNLKGTLQCP